ncbi:epoxide hydrolase family protein [Mesorhizobium sp. ANAO-SY3R2]|uniref:epoxide hydrolase family protein n=1 Tax=Mesorhizobium sp. ANAO-SY3R2 TaxID=3166644 RepID=UPI00366DDB84
MSAASLSPTRRELLAAAATAGAISLVPGALREALADKAIRPFTVNVPQAEIDELRRRIAATRWPERETVGDQSQGIRLEKLKPLVEYWGTSYDWRKAEAKLNSLPQFITEIDGLDIHFIHIRSKHPKALPLIMTHGWPGSVLELLKAAGPLTDPTVHGGAAVDAFDLVLPSMPGYGFSGKPTAAGWGVDRIAKTWVELMNHLGYTRYVAQGGDWGSPVSGAMARQAPAGLLGIHINLPAVVPPEIATVLAAGGPAPTGLSDKERTAFDALSSAARKGNRSYAVMMGSRPETIGYSITDSPAGLAAWMLGHPGFTNWTYDSSDPEKSPDEVLDDITLYWVTGTATSAARLYWEHAGASPIFAAAQKTSEISLPVAITVFPGESYQAPETWARRAYRNLSYFHEVDKGGHFAAWEEPELFSAELRAAFRPLR